jgi:hypothetical protein
MTSMIGEIQLFYKEKPDIQYGSRQSAAVNIHVLQGKAYGCRQQNSWKI